MIGIGISSPRLEPFHEDPAAKLIFPAVERFLPAELDHHLARVHAGDWHYNVLTPQRMLRFELLQACHPDQPFYETLRDVWHAWRTTGCVSGAIPTSSSLAEARARLPTWSLQFLFRHTAALVSQALPPSPWPGHRVLTLDASLLAVPNTASLRSHFTATCHHHGESYFPQALSVWLVLASNGGVIAEHLGSSRQGEESIAPYMVAAHLSPDDLILGDGRIGTYATIAQVVARQAFFLFRAPGRLKLDLHIIRRYAPDDADLRLSLTPHVRRRYRDLALPECLELRAASFSIPARDDLNRTVQASFLTNLPRASFVPSVLARLAWVRWGHETVNNDIKTRLGLGDIRSQTPEAVRREDLAHLCLGNLVRLLMTQAFPTLPLTASFTSARGALHRANQALRLGSQGEEEQLQLLLEMIRMEQWSYRPIRAEPRMARPSKRRHRIFKFPRAEWRAERKAG